MNTIIKSILVGAATGGLVKAFTCSIMSDDIAAKAIYVRDKQREKFMPKQDIDEEDFIEEKELEKIIDDSSTNQNNALTLGFILAGLLSLGRNVALTWHTWIPIAFFVSDTIRTYVLVKKRTKKLNELYKRYKKEEKENGSKSI